VRTPRPAFLKAIPPDENAPSKPAAPLVVGLDGCYVHAKGQRSRTEGWSDTGHAKSIVVSLSSSVDQSTLRITDNGVGFLAAARAKGGLGLRIMEYRAEMIGATFRIGSANGKGTTAACTFKLNRLRQRS
jgi:poly(3-hydroxybutyrate) depolymerase